MTIGLCSQKGKVFAHLVPCLGLELQEAGSLSVLVISPKYVPSEPAEECVHATSCADITQE